MPQLQSLVLTDRTPTTAVDHTFAPRDIKSGVGAVVESSGVPIGDNRFTISLRQINNRYKAQMQLAVPVPMRFALRVVEVSSVFVAWLVWMMVCVV